MAANLNPLNKLASSILNSFLSNYFESFQNKVVNFSLGGDIELTELEVKKDVLDGLRLPIQIKFGSLGRLKCSVPWAELTKKPTVVYLNQLFLIIEPSTVTKYDPKEEEERQQKLKQQKLKVFKMQQLAKPEEDTGKKASKNFGQRMATNILANLQVEINNIHIRFEDGKAPIPFAAGLTIENLRVQTTDEKWKVTKVKPSGVSYKLTSVNNMAVYFNIGEKPLRYNSLAEAYKLMEALIPTDLNAVKHDYIVKMESLRVKATIDQDATAADDKPKIYATVVSDRIPIDLSKGQYDAAMFLTKKMTSHTTLTKYLQHRPTDKTVKDAPKTWWQFAST
jgi:vacuolar protein sorting-associated protein 13A/C